MDHQYAFDGAAGDNVVVFFRSEDGWQIVRDDQPTDLAVPAVAPPPRFRWTETSWVETVQGWAEQYAEGEFVLTDDQREMIAATFRALVAEGKVTHGLSGEQLGWTRR